MRHYTPIHFKAHELLPPAIFQKYGEGGLVVMDPRILWTLDMIRKTIGKAITVNTWREGGHFSQRGFRNDPGVGAPLSQHRFGRAVDFDIAGFTADEFRNDVRRGLFANEMTYVTRMEDNVSWIHIDCAPVPGTQIVFFNP